MAITLDGTDGITTPQINAGNIVGQVCFFGMTTAPEGFLKANGAAVSRTTYAALFAAIGTTYGAGDGSTTFNLPDLRGEFPRGFDDGRGVDVGRGFGGFQDFDTGDHQHKNSTGNDGAIHTYGFTDPIYGSEVLTGTPATRAAGGWVAAQSNVRINYTSGRFNQSSETRPRNVALLACIKF